MAKINSYPKCSTIRLRGIFTDGDGLPYDPTVVMVQVITPAGVQTNYTYGTSGDGVQHITPNSGNYYKDVECSAAGTWKYRWHSTGGLSADENEFEIHESAFAEPGA